MMETEETYLGGGLYASFNGYQICLRAPRYDGDALVYLEPPVLDALKRYVESIRAKATAS